MVRVQIAHKPDALWDTNLHIFKAEEYPELLNNKGNFEGILVGKVSYKDASDNKYPAFALYSKVEKHVFKVSAVSYIALIIEENSTNEALGFINERNQFQLFN